ncbi:hypothetical protein BD311DRAFT_676579 [Dichomitus squalens]|uniref:Uncharacterized protein n=1 Tax=Dichomitus squalens TaxID=114155 RepID=A0A4Q9M5K4_9APHY|nr:hypothetical protein BD311DRAFT_676579 [Dichomitus squalens]
MKLEKTASKYNADANLRDVKVHEYVKQLEAKQDQTIVEHVRILQKVKPRSVIE